MRDVRRPGNARCTATGPRGAQKRTRRRPGLPGIFAGPPAIEGRGPRARCQKPTSPGGVALAVTPLAERTASGRTRLVRWRSRVLARSGSGCASARVRSSAPLPARALSGTAASVFIPCGASPGGRDGRAAARASLAGDQPRWVPRTCAAVRLRAPAPA